MYIGNTYVKFYNFNNHELRDSHTDKKKGKKRFEKNYIFQRRLNCFCSKQRPR